MTGDADVDALCSAYLAKLSDSLSALSPGDRRQIVDQVSEHIANARAALPTQSEAAVRDILDRLGTPEEIAASARAEVAPPPRGGARKPVLVGAAALVVLIVVGVALAGSLGAFGHGGNGSVPSVSPPRTSLPGPGSTASPAGTVSVPDLVGQEVSAAVQQLGTRGLSYTLRYGPGSQAVGTVLEQRPSAGSRVVPESRVRLTVTGTQTSETVPDVVGESQAQAAAALSSAGLDVRFVMSGEGSAAPGTVTGEAPAAGAAVEQQSVVTLTVS